MTNKSFKTVLYGVGADFVFWIHLAVVLLVVVGWLWPKLFYPSIILLAATLLSEIFLGFCPLTRLEFGIRKKLDPRLSFDKSCTSHYTRKWRGLPPREMREVVGSFFKRKSFLFVLLGLAAVNIAYNTLIH